MIKNIIFDLGGVIFDYNPRKYIEKFGYDNKTTELLVKEVFFGKEWMSLATKPIRGLSNCRWCYLFI